MKIEIGGKWNDTHYWVRMDMAGAPDCCVSINVVHALIRNGMVAQRQIDADLLNESARIMAAQIILSDKPELAKKLADLLLEASGSVLDQLISDDHIAAAIGGGR